MAETERIAVLGSRESVLGFRALGLEVYPVADVSEAKEKLRELANGNCAIIYLTETLAGEMMDAVSRYQDALRPAIILIPGPEGSLGMGQTLIRQAVERAVGKGIL